MRQLKSLIVALVLVAGPALAGPFEDGLAAYGRQDYATALRQWRPLAIGGDASAQYNLGVMYDNGTGVPKDEQQAVFWYRKAAEQGHASAQYNLGVMYDKGRGVAKDDQQAVFWYRKAAEQGVASAQGNLGSIYANGQGVPQDYQQAALWYRKAAEQGHASAQHHLGIIYSTGRGVAKDDQEATLWYRQAAEQGYALSQYNLGNMYADGRGVPKDDQQAYFWSLLASVSGNADAVRNRDIFERQLTAQQRAAAQADARNWKPTAAKASADAPRLPKSGRDNRADSTGSGFRVAGGRIVTNNHVVEKCSRILVNGNLAAQVLARDARNDLAIVEATEDRGPAASVRATRSRLGEEVAIAGYPLQGLLSGLSVTKGNVSRLSGLAGDSRLLQISAPVQPGNSGGPLLDASANVIGVVVSKLDALRVAKATGDIPQNVNFALTANVLRAFLDANDVQYADGTSVQPLSPTEVASRAARFTVLVECWK